MLLNSLKNKTIQNSDCEVLLDFLVMTKCSLLHSAAHSLVRLFFWVSIFELISFWTWKMNILRLDVAIHIRFQSVFYVQKTFWDRILIATSGIKTFNCFMFPAGLEKTPRDAAAVARHCSAWAFLCCDRKVTTANSFFFRLISSPHKRAILPYMYVVRSFRSACGVRKYLVS